MRWRLADGGGPVAAGEIPAVPGQPAGVAYQDALGRADCMPLLVLVVKVVVIFVQIVVVEVVFVQIFVFEVVFFLILVEII